jgi:hypothetical protein|tara:strand:+ start:788 stop:958 length:171 start_codon:yes stop_codon:yes gene_type:complete
MREHDTVSEKLMQEYLENGGVITKCATGDSGLEEGDQGPWKRKPQVGRPKKQVSKK